MPVRGAKCALCPKPAAHRIDLTFSELNPGSSSEYTVQHVLRGVLICTECQVSGTIGKVLQEAGQGVRLIRGCFVQCADEPPWYLRHVLPGGPWWSKVICPSCHGRATVQHVGDAVERPESAWRGGLRQALEIMSFRRAMEEEEELYDPDPMDGDSRNGIPDRQGLSMAGDHDSGDLGPDVASDGIPAVGSHSQGEGHQGIDGSQASGEEIPAVREIAINALDLSNYER